MVIRENSYTSNRLRRIAIILLILTTLLWGTSFIITKKITQEIPIFLYLGLRFLIAIIGLLPYLIKIKQIDKRIIIWGSITGLLYFIAIVFQTIGLQTTTAGKAAFITGLSTIMVPFIAWLGFKRSINKRIWIAVFISTIGMAFLLLEGEAGIIIGDILVLICAVLYAIFIILNDKYVNLINVYLYSIVQLLIICLFCFGSSFLLNESYSFSSFELGYWLVIIYMGIIVTTGTFIFQNWGQQHQKPAQTAIIFTLEPVFAILFASFIIGNETMTIFGWLGCGLIFVAILITVLKIDENNKNKKN
ncbi:MAG: DMT family transporter [Candidatus Hodarchaeota archaeon]